MLRIAAAAGGIAAIGLLRWTNTSSRPTDEDKHYLRRMFPDSFQFERGGNYYQEIRKINQVQRIVREWTGFDDPDVSVAHLRKGERRDAKALYEARSGSCVERSRLIELALAHCGFRVRHVVIFADTGSSRIVSLLDSETQSHALSEVKTSEGWLAVDSNSQWNTIASTGAPVPAARMKEASTVGHVSPIPSTLHPDYLVVHGLYSRHGRYYPPFIPVPNINYLDFARGFAHRVRTERPDYEVVSVG